MMQYEDVQRPDISVKFGAEGLVKERESQVIKSLQKTERVNIYLFRSVWMAILWWPWQAILLLRRNQTRPTNKLKLK